MLKVTRAYEVPCEAMKVWKYFSDFEIWADWVELNGLFSRRKYAFSWADPAAPGARIAVEINRKASTPWVAREWDPPRRFKVSSMNEVDEAGHFEFALTLTPLSSTSTRVEFETSIMPGPDNFLTAFIPMQRIFEGKVDAIIARANKLLA